MEAYKLLILTMLALSQASDVWGEKPSFCGAYECPVYQVVKQYEDFELRLYAESRWVSTTLEQDFLGVEIMKGFRRLFHYISGTNAYGMKLNMTAPVLINVPVKKSPAGNTTMSFYIPPEVESPPEPLDHNVYLWHLPQTSYYVRSFGGYAIGYHYAREANKLAEELLSLGLGFDDSFYYRSGYDSPFTLFNRHNEVWFRTK